MMKIKHSITLALDVGHSSIGWALFRGEECLGCGVVTFQADDCLAKKRRDYRRQRRHVRATRMRIWRMERLLIQAGVFNEKEVEQMHDQAGGHPAPWLLAARVLNASDPTPFLLSKCQLWDVIRWYAHNRGYNANKLWSRGEEENKEDTEKIANARKLMGDFKRETMAETVTDFMFSPFPEKKPYAPELPVLPFFSTKSRYKGQNAAFPREAIEKEARRLLEAHIGHVPGIDARLVSALLDDWKEVRSDKVNLPLRYQGGLLFGQLLPRFENRIISTCPFTGEKVATKNSFEFLRYRWAMQMMGVQVQDEGAAKMRALSTQERLKLTQVIEERGYLSDGEFKKNVRQITGCKQDNLDALLLHPESKEALQILPLASGKDAFRAVWSGLTPHWRNTFGIQLQRGKVLTAEKVMSFLTARNSPETAETLRQSLHAAAQKKGRFDEAKHHELLHEEFSWKPQRGRAPFSRSLLRQAVDEVMRGLNPRKKCRANDPQGGEDKTSDGCLVTTDQMQQEALMKPLDQQTNNHLVRHRLLILERLVKDISNDASLTGGEKIAQVAIEVNRDLKDMSGMTAKEKASEMTEKLKNFKSVVAYLEDRLDTKQHPITPGLIRKARVAMDLDWMDPYTGEKFQPVNLAERQYDRDHIIPYSQRPSNSLDSLVMTTPEINKEKANRTALEFIEHMNRPENLARRDQLHIWSVKQYKDFVASLDLKKGHDDDRKRKRRRQSLMLLPKWDDKNAGFLPRDLTMTSQLTRLGAQSVRRVLSHLQPHEVVSIPGSVTGVLRTGWKLLGLLAQANPLVKQADSEDGVKTKTEIREITHLHHALDACVLALTTHYLPANGRAWEAVVKRNHSPEEKALLKSLGVFSEDSEGKMRLERKVPQTVRDQIAARLCEKRVVQHVPKDYGGMRTGENTHGVKEMNDTHVKISPPFQNKDTWTKDKVVGLRPGKLKKQNGVRVITDNYGVAVLDALPEDTLAKDRFVAIPWHDVKQHMKDARVMNHGREFRLIRKGDVIELDLKGEPTRVQIFGFGTRERDGMYFDVAAVDGVTRSPNSLSVVAFWKAKGRVIKRSFTGS